MNQAKLVPSDPCHCGVPMYVPAGFWQLRGMAPVWFWACEHGPRRIRWADLLPEQQHDLARISAVAAVRLKLAE